MVTLRELGVCYVRFDDLFIDWVTFDACLYQGMDLAKGSIGNIKRIQVISMVEVQKQ